MKDASLLQVHEVSKRYYLGPGIESLLILNRVSLDVAAGDTVAIVGPSGSGKSTLLNIIGTLDRPNEGSVAVDGRDLTELDDGALAAVRNRSVGFVFQLQHLLPQCTVLENVLVPALAMPGPAVPDEVVDRARRLLERVGLEDRLSYRPGQLSGGERQRTAVARALINRPRLLLADEPTGSLDHAAAQNLAQLLVEVNREEGTALIVVTHAQALAARLERVYLLNDGSLSPVKGA